MILTCPLLVAFIIVAVGKQVFPTFAQKRQQLMGRLYLQVGRFTTKA